MKARTKEEKLLVALYEAALQKGDPDAEVDRFLVGQKIGLHPRGINTICNELAQSNFIRKRGETGAIVTAQGLRLINELKGL